ncbi:hypothetical protein BHE74_00038122 [Ensete ventricosum]|nr:hypothetical protein BHE74_00038122 [Ensete ventricosum]
MIAEQTFSRTAEQKRGWQKSGASYPSPPSADKACGERPAAGTLSPQQQQAAKDQIRTTKPSPANEEVKSRIEVSLHGLGIGGEAREADVELFVDLEDPLEVSSDGLEVDPKAAVAGDRKAILPDHRHQGAPIVLEDLKGNNILDSFQNTRRRIGTRGLSFRSNAYRHQSARREQRRRRRRRRARGNRKGGGLANTPWNDQGFRVSSKTGPS